MKPIIALFTLLLSGLDIAQAENTDPKDCLAKTVYFESRGEPAPGQFAVASVVMNRVRSEIYPNTVCKVVHQPYQFSWTLLKGLNNQDKKAWVQAQYIASILIDGHLKSNVGESLDYHSTTIKPKWAKHYVKNIVIGNHIFYLRKEKT